MYVFSNFLKNDGTPKINMGKKSCCSGRTMFFNRLKFYEMAVSKKFLKAIKIMGRRYPMMTRLHNTKKFNLCKLIEKLQPHSEKA